MSESLPSREERLSALASRVFDVLVVGGGITGAAVARDAACRGLSAVLVEREDWGSGTSWRSSKLIHGGLRYLQTGDVGLVFESLSERGRLMRLAPHLVWPEEFLFAAYRGRGFPRWVLELGLTAYEALALRRLRKFRRRLSRDEVIALEPPLASPDLLGGSAYGDGRTDDARLTLENVLDAAALGVVALSRVEVLGLLRDGSGKLRGAQVRDRDTGREFEVQARVVVNAAGPWVDEVRRQDDAAAGPWLRLAKGVHLSFPAARLSLHRTIAFPSTDGRMLFAIPDGPATLLGTTDTDYPGSLDNVAAEAQDVDYLLDQASRTFPGARLGRSDVLATFAGLRPLLREPGKRVEDTSRREAIRVSSSGLVTVTGGKLTTHRGMGARTMDQAAALLTSQGVAVPPSPTGERRFPGAPDVAMENFVRDLGIRAVSLCPGLDERSVRHLAWRYGKRAGGVLELAARDPGLARPLCPGLPDIEAEVVFAARHEDARSLCDVLIRRTHLFWQAPRQGEACLERASRLLAGELGWDEPRRLEDIAEYERELAVSRRFRIPEIPSR